MLLFFISVFGSISQLGNSGPHPNEQSKVQKMPLVNEQIINDHTVPNDYLTKLVTPNQMLNFNDYSVDYAQLNGALFIDKENPHQFEKDEEGKLTLKADNLSNHFSVTMPMTLFPSPFPTELYEKARELQQLMAEVHLRVSQDYTFIKKNMKKVAEADPTFIGRLVNIMDAVKGNRRQSGLTLILQRSDYLTNVDQPTNGGPTTLSLKQIEVTSGTNAGQGDGHAASVVHQRMLNKIRLMTEPDKLPAWFSKVKVPDNEVLQNQAEALFKTWLRFSETHGDPRAVILLISAPKRRGHSHYEQLNWAQFRLEDVAMAYEKERKKEGENTKGKYKPHLVQITIKECAERLSLNKEDNHHLILHNEMGEDRRVAVAVFLDGYLPEHFPTDKEWDIRRDMELSNAVMQPNIFVYFTNTKKIQQALAEPGELESFFPEAKEDTPDGRKLAKNLAELRATFIEQWGLGSGSAEEEEEVERAKAFPDHYVLKANLEAGKGNFFGEDVAKMLREMTLQERGVYILQKKVRPFHAKNVFVPIPLVSESQLSFVDVSTEVSIFGSLLAETVASGSSSRAGGLKRKHEAMATDHSQNVLLNTVDGYVSRSKITSNHMCTVSSGRGGFDSMALFPVKHFHHEQPASCLMDVDVDKLAKEEEAEAA